MAGMDALGGFLDGPRARGAFALRALMSPPWSIEVRDRAPLSVVAMLEGHAWICQDGAEPVPVRPGDVALLRGPEPYVFADEPTRPVQVVILPGQHCASPTGESLSAAMDLGVRSWGNSMRGETVMLIGSYQGEGEISRRLTDALPPLVVLRDGQWDAPVLPILVAEIGRELPGQAAVLDRLLDLLVISGLRAWFEHPDARPPAWFAAHADPSVGAAIELLHEAPQRPWTVASLAAEVGLSRAALARRFHDAVGEPPMSYLTGWRLALAADLLAEPGVTVGAVSRRVGYASPFTFSTAFKRAYGRSPKQHRAVQAGSGSGWLVR
jgi:AraC-like DNA-binding protein